MITIDEAILHAKESARENRYRATHRSFHKNDKDEINACIRCAEEHEQLAEWLEKLKYIENIILKWNADIYNDEDTGIPDDEILEAIFNACTDNGFDIQIDEDYRKGYNNAIDDFYTLFISEVKNRYPDMPIFNFRLQRSVWEMENAKYIECEEIALKIAEQLKKGGADAGSI